MDPTILLCEDEEDLRALYLEWLSEEGYEAWTASNGAEAGKVMRSCVPNLILSDINMPEVDGWELLADVRDNYSDRIPVILMSGNGDEKTKMEALRRGANAFLAKPFTKAQLLATIAELK